MKRGAETAAWSVLSTLVLILAASVACAGETLGPEDIDIRQLEMEVVRELNAVRANPGGYLPHLREMLKHFHGKEFRYPGAVPVVTQEGASAVAEAIRFLEKARPVQTLTLSRGMSRGARDHVEDQGSMGGVGHLSAEGSQPWERISRYGTWRKAAGENISYGKSRPREVLTSLIIDDGVPGRGHRRNIFNPGFRFVGVGWGAHAAYRTMCVIVFAGEYVEKKA